MLAVYRFRVPEGEQEGFGAEAWAALAALGTRPGHVDGVLGRNLDDPSLWTLVTRWRDIGSYRRALAAYDVKVAMAGLAGRMLDEPGAYETLDHPDARSSSTGGLTGPSGR